MKNWIKLSLVSALTLSICNPQILNASTSSTMTADDLSLDVSKKMRDIYASIGKKDKFDITRQDPYDLEAHGKALVAQITRNNYIIPQDLLTDAMSPLCMIIGTLIGELNLMEKLDESVKIAAQLSNSSWSGKERTFRHFPWGDPDSWDDATKKTYFAKLLPVLKPHEALFLTPGTEQFDADFVTACMKYAPDRETQVRYAQALLKNLELTDLSKKSPLDLERRMDKLSVGVPDALRLGLLDRTSGAVTIGISALLNIYNQEIEPLITLVSQSSSASESDNDDAPAEDEDPAELIIEFADVFASYLPYTQDYLVVLSTLEQLMFSKIGLTERITLLRASKQMKLTDRFSHWNSLIKVEISKGQDPFMPWLHVAYIPVADMPELALRSYVAQNLKRDPSFKSLISLAFGANFKESDYAKKLVSQDHRQTFDTFFKTEKNFAGLEGSEDDGSSLSMTSAALAVFLNEEEFPWYFDRFIEMIKRNTSPQFFRSELSDLYAFDLMRAAPGGHTKIQQRMKNLHSEVIKLFLN